MIRFPSIFIIFSLLGGVLPVFSQTWQAGTSDWNTVGNWLGGNIPDTNVETATFSSTGNTTIDLSANTTVQKLVFGASSQAYTLQSASGKALTIDINSVGNGTFLTTTPTSGAITINNKLIFTDTNGAVDAVLMNMSTGTSLTINGDIQMLAAQSMTFSGASVGNLYINGAVDLAGGQFQHSSPGNVYFNPTSTSNITSVRGLNTGILYLLKDFTSGTLNVGGTTVASPAGNIYLATAGMSMSRNFTFNSGTGGAGDMTFGADMTNGGTATQAGTITISVGAGAGTFNNNLDAKDANDIFNISGVISGTQVSGTTTIKKTGAGTVILSGAAANTFASGAGTVLVNVAAGTLELNKTAGVNAIGNIATTVQSGATLKWDASNQVGDTAAMTLAGGTLNLNGNSETMGTLSATANSFIDMGSGTSALVFSDSSATLTANTVSISNYSIGSDTLRFGAAAGTVDLTRTIFADFGGVGGVNDGTGFITPDSTKVTITGNDIQLFSVIAGTNGINQTGSGVMTVTANDTSTGLATVSNGTLVIGTVAGGSWAGDVIVNGGTLKGRGRIGGSLTLNSGIYSPGNSPGIQNVGTFVVNGGTHLVEIDGRTAGNGSGFYDQTIAAGAVTLNGGTLQAQTNFSGSTGYAPLLGSKVNFLQGTSIHGNYSAYDFSNNAPGLSWMPEYRATEVNLYAVPNDWGVNVSGMSHNQTQVGRALQNFRPNQVDNRGALNDPEKIFNGLMRQDNDGIKRAYDQLSPESLSAMSAGVNQFSAMSNGGAGQRLQQLRRGDRGVSLNGLSLRSLEGDSEYEHLAMDQGSILMKKKKPGKETGFFVNTTGAYSQVDHDPNRIGYENRLEGVTAGFDRALGEAFNAGVFAGQGYASTLLENGGTLDSNSGRIGVYGGYHDRGFYVNTSLAVGTTGFESKRRISFIGENAKGSTQGYDLSGQVATGLDFQNGNWIWGPTAKLDYSSQWIEGFDEKGSAARLRVAQQQANFVETGAGLRISRPFDYKGWKWIPEAHLLGAYQWIKPNAIRSQFIAGGGAFTVYPEGEGQERIIPGIGLSLYFDENTSFSMGYEARMNQVSSSHQLDLGVQTRF